MNAPDKLKWVEPERIVGATAIRVWAFEPGEELEAVGASREAIGAYAERRLGAEGVHALWEGENEDGDEPSLTISVRVVDLSQAGENMAGYVISLAVNFYRVLPVAPGSDWNTSAILWTRCGLRIAAPDNLAREFWPHLGRCLDEFVSDWRSSRYARVDLPATPPVRGQSDDTTRLPRPDETDNTDNASVDTSEMTPERFAALMMAAEDDPSAPGALAKTEKPAKKRAAKRAAPNNPANAEPNNDAKPRRRKN